MCFCERRSSKDVLAEVLLEESPAEAERKKKKKQAACPSDCPPSSHRNPRLHGRRLVVIWRRFDQLEGPATQQDRATSALLQLSAFEPASSHSATGLRLAQPLPSYRLTASLLLLSCFVFLCLVNAFYHTSCLLIHRCRITLLLPGLLSLCSSVCCSLFFFHTWHSVCPVFVHAYSSG